MATLDVLGYASLVSFGLALIGVGLFRARDHVGLAPFVVVFAFAAGTVPGLAHRSTLWAGDLGHVAGSIAIAGPVAIALVVVVHLVRGWSNAQHVTFGIPIATGLATGLAVSAMYLDLGLGGLVAADPRIPLLVGAALWVGAVSATVSLRVFHRWISSSSTVTAGIVATLFGVGMQGASLVGLGQAEIAGFAPGLGPLIVPSIVALAPAILAGAAAHRELGGLSPTSRRLMVSGQPLEDDDRLETLRELQETSKESSAEDQRASETYERLLDTDTTGAYVCDKDGMVSYANKALSRMLTLGDHQFEGENIRHFLARSTQDQEGAFAEYPVTPGTHTAKITLPNGHTKTLEFRVKLTNGKVHGRVVDKTEQVLRERVEEEKERAEFYIDLLMHDVENHVETPLEYLRQLEDDPELEDDQRRYVTASRAAVENIADVLHGVDVLERAENAKAQPVHVNRMMHRIAKRFSEENPGITKIQIDLPDGPVIVAGSPLLEHVLANLVDNAIQHAHGEVTVRLSAHRNDGDWILCVDDDGPGVPDEMKDHIFHRDAKHEESAGRGLGLYIVDTIVHGLNGEVWVTDRTNQPDDGASFRVRLPAVHPDAVGETSGHSVTGGSTSAGEPGHA